MLSENEEIRTRLSLEANHLNRIQCMVLENAAGPQILREIQTVNRALTAIKVDLIQWNIEHCSSILQDCPDRETQAQELQRLIQLLTAV